MVEKPTPDRRSFLKAIGAGTLFGGLSGVASATPGRRPGPKPDEILVGVSASAADMEGAVREAVPGNAEIVHRNETLSYVAVKFPSQASANAKENFIDAVTRRDHIKYAEPNATHGAFYDPSDPRFGDQYAPKQVKSDQAWDTTLGDAGVTIAVVDTGAQYDHPDLAANYRADPGRDFADDDADPYPDVPSDEYHGTHVSGCAAAVIDNGTGVAGQGNSSLVNGRALDENGSGSTSDIADAIEWAADQGADVINLSTTTEARGSYERLSGTSMATPVTAGVAGLTLAKWDLTNAELRTHLKNTAEDIGLSADKQGSGQVDALAAVTTDPGDGGGGGGGGGESTSGSVSDTLYSSSDYDDYTWSWTYSSPSKVVVELDGPIDADFDLYVNTGTTRNASPSNYDYASYSTDSQERIAIDSPDDSTAMQIDVDSYSGSGDYTLTVTETQ